MLDRLALEVLVRVAGIGDAVPEEPRVERPTRVDVGFAEVGVAERVLLLGQCRCRSEPKQAGGEQRTTPWAYGKRLRHLVGHRVLLSLCQRLCRELCWETVRWSPVCPARSRDARAHPSF